MQQTFGFEAASTRYAAMEQTLRHVPKRVGLFNYVKLMGEMMLVTSKDMILGRESTGVFSFEHDGGRGFQINDPARSNDVRVIYFDQHDKQIEFEVRRDRDAPALTQGEIDYVVRSIRAVPEGAAEPVKPTKPSGKPATKRAAKARFLVRFPLHRGYTPSRQKRTMASVIDVR